MTARHRIGPALTVLCVLAGTSTSHGARRPGLRAARGAALAESQPVGGGPSLGFPYALAADPSGALFVADRNGPLYVSCCIPVPVDPSIVRIDPDGTHTLVADAWRGSGPRLAGADLFLEPDGQLLFGLLRVDPATGDRVALPPITGVSGLRVLSLLPESESSILLGGQSGLVRYDRATGHSTVLSGCASSTACVPVGSGPALGDIWALAPWTEGRVLALASGLLAVDLDTGERTLVSGRGRGVGPAIEFGIGSIAVEPSGHLLVANGPPPGSSSLQSSSIVRVDPDTGDRVMVSGENEGAGPALRTIERMILESAGTLALADSNLGAVVRVDVATGDRSIVSGGPIGAGPLPSCATAADREATGALVVADCEGGILRVDLETGDRNVVSDGNTGAGPVLDAVRDVAVEPSGMLLAVDGASLKRVHPESGDRTTVSNRRRGRFYDARALALESANSALVGDDGLEIPIPSGGLLLNFQAYSALRRVDLATGRSTVVSGGGLLSGRRGRGPGLLWLGVPFLTLVSPNAVATSALYNELIGVVSLSRLDLVTGDRTLVSGPDRGTGPGIGGAADLAVDESGIWWVVDVGQDALYRVDPATGDRTRVSGHDRGRGPQLDHPRAVLVGADGALIVVSSGYRHTYVRYPFYSVMRVDPVTGDRTVLSRY